MSKSIELTPIQIKALQSGATMFIISINKLQQKDIDNKFFINNFSPIQKNDKDIFVKEKFNCIGDCNFGIPCQNCGSNGQGIGIFQASQMTKEQSRFSFSECIDVRVVRVRDIKIVDISKLLGDEFYDNFGRTIDKFYNQQMQEQNINKTYEDNDYIFLVEFKK